MITRHKLSWLLLTLLSSVAVTVSAQDTAEEEAPVTDTDSAEAETGDTSAAPEAEAESMSEVSEEIETADDSALTESTSESLELDYEALGDMDPAADMAANAAVTSGDTAGTKTEGWTDRNLELFEMHGYFRVRPELYHKFYIRNDKALYPLNTDQQAGCEDDEKCATLAGANMRFRFSPTINVSEEVRVHSQIDFLDNVMLGSNPQTYDNFPEGNTAHPDSATGYNQGSPPASFINVRRVWGEMESPLGHLRFGRMPSHFGTGMLYNSGDGLDDDFGDSVDRLSFAFKLNGWMIMPAFDFPNEGLYMDSSSGRPFDVSQLDDSYRAVAVIAYQHELEDQLAMLKRGDSVINAGLHFSYQAQAMHFEWTMPGDADYENAIDNQITPYERDMWSVTPDLWFELMADTFHLQAELAFHFGNVGEPSISDVDDVGSTDILSWGAVVHADYGLLSDQLRFGLKFGIASGDRDVEGVNTPSSFDQPNGSSSKYSQFAFNPGYNVDLILYHHILGSVSGTYHFRPWIRYDFLKATLGKKLGAQLDIIYTRAYYEESTISNSSGNLGLEIDAKVDFVTADNFYATLKYGILFPLGGFKGDYEGENEVGEALTYRDTDLSIPQTLQLLLGITF